MLPKSFSFFQLLMCFTLFKNHKISIFNCTVAVKTIVTMKTFLGNFLVTFSDCFFYNCWTCSKIWFLLSQCRELHHRLCILISIALFWNDNFWYRFLVLNLKTFLVCFCQKCCSSTYRITDQAIFFLTCFTSSFILKFE